MLISLIRAVILYLALILVVRLMGKRQLGEMEPMEFVVTMLIANLAAVPMQETGTPLLAGLLPILVVLSMELVLSVLSYKSVPIRRFLCGKPVVLIENGKLLQENLKKTRVHTDELTEYLRIQGVTDLTQVQYAILETSGAISTFLYPKYQPGPGEGRRNPGTGAEAAGDGDRRGACHAGESEASRPGRELGAAGAAAI